MTKTQLLKIIKRITLQISILKSQLLLLRKPIKYIIIHHTATSRDFTKYITINENHRKRWNFKSQLGQYCGYTYFIEGDGKITQARLDMGVGAHTRGHNKKTIGICLSGSFSKERPAKEQLGALEMLLNEKIVKYGLNKNQIKGHRDFSATICPGDSLYKWIQEFKGRL